MDNAFLTDYVAELLHAAPTMAVVALCSFTATIFWLAFVRRWASDRTWLGRAISYTFLTLALAGGLWMAHQQASLVDDSFISFRYARNFVDGHGLVFNVGERVEGYTNFLWVVLVAALMRITRLDAPVIGLWLCPLFLVSNLTVVHFVGRRLCGANSWKPYIPLAALVLASHWAFTSFGTTGMETMAASTFVLAGAGALLLRSRRLSAFLPALFFILAALTRPDHGLFYACGGLALLAVVIQRAIAARNAHGTPTTTTRLDLKEAAILLALYAAPFVVYALYMGWKVDYYGSLLPNTYYAKSADQAYYSQGLTYAATFYLGSHFFIQTILFGVWVLWRSRRPGLLGFKVFTGASVVLYNLYVIKVGGDFMYGRFYLSLLPLCLLGAEALFYNAAVGPALPISRRRTAAAAALAGLLATSAVGLHLIGPNKIRWGIADEGSVYRLEQLSPPVVHHPNFRVGTLFGTALADRGITPFVATTGIGMLGYYSKLPVIDIRGLTDVTVARAELQQRGRPGHEKRASNEYMVQRGVRFLRWKVHRKHDRIVRLTMGRNMGKTWRILVYDRDLMQRMAREVPEIDFVDFEAHLDRYIARLESHDTDTIRADLDWFRSYYFDHNDDPQRLRAIEDELARRQD